jgi:hypothetical protein
MCRIYSIGNASNKQEERKENKLTLNPKPIRKRNPRTQPQRRPKPNRPRRAKQQQIDQQKRRRSQMEAQIYPQRQLQLLGHYESWVDGSQSPVESADETFEGRGADGEDVFCLEERAEGGQVREEGGEEG